VESTVEQLEDLLYSIYLMMAYNIVWVTVSWLMCAIVENIDVVYVIQNTGNKVNEHTSILIELFDLQQ